MRDDAGEIWLQPTEFYLVTILLMLLKLLGMRKVLSWLKELNVQEIEIETDSLQLITALQNPQSDFSHFGLLVIDCNNLALGFNLCKFSIVHQLTNYVAHHLAQCRWFYAWVLAIG